MCVPKMAIIAILLVTLATLAGIANGTAIEWAARPKRKRKATRPTRAAAGPKRIRKMVNGFCYLFVYVVVKLFKIR